MLLCRLAELGKLVRLAKHVVDTQEIRRVVAVVAARLEDGVEVEHRHAHVREVVELLADAGERAAVEVPGADATLLVAVVTRLGVPAVNHTTDGAGHAVVGVPGVEGKRPLRDMAPARPATIAVGEDLIHDARGKPVRLHLARAVHRELEARRLPLHQHALATRTALLRAVAHHAAVGALDGKRVPDDGRILAREVAREAQVVAFLRGVHGQEALALAIYPCTQGAACAAVTAHVDGDAHGAARWHGAKREPIRAVTTVVECPHVRPAPPGAGPAPGELAATGYVSCCME